MTNKTPSYKDKILKEFDEEFDGSLWSDPDELAIPKYREVNDFIVRALDEQMKLVMECLPMNMETDPKKYSGYYDCLKETRENLKSKGLI